ncbi:serine/threonine-protein phosphatase [Crocinitomicaceae bacterium CZZ-1]|uniref:Serine/threonine-protein phosphatase n=1 Tax=Taishania pollutisoli TaxID=2766479 RepID=A0A8J6TZG2_9FLAO|nr:PP2C family protein-serine/threonine phosphatase [Taishania pollutisoli]MBC9812083.1 serine/threonine-protein phosphatase [Taishania pollutisoli]
MYDKRINDLEIQLFQKEFKLNSLLEITTAINANSGVDRLREIYSFILKEQLGFSRFILFTRQDENQWDLLIKKGVRGKLLDIDVQQELARFREITFIASSSSEVLRTFDIVVPVFHKEMPLAYLLLKVNTPIDFYQEDTHNNLGFIQTLTNIIVVAIENKLMAKQRVIQERIKKELEVASEMQKLLFPSDLPSNKQMDISAKYIPRHEVGGDYYDFIPLGNNEFIMCIGDVSGKGIGAAMLMANFQATLRTLFIYQRYDLEFLVTELNEKVMESAKGEKFITFFIAHFNAETRLLKYVNAGHNHPILTTGKEVTMLKEGTIGLGMLDELPFINIGEVTLKPNTTLISYTDGVVELENREETQFGLERLIKTVHSFYPLSMEDMNNLIFSKLDEWRGELPLVDDTAVFACRFF